MASHACREAESAASGADPRHFAVGPETPAAGLESTLRFEFARAIIERDVAARALPQLGPTFNLDEAVRLGTAGKGYAPAPQTHCPHCPRPVSTFDRVAIEIDARGKVIAVYHASCR